MVNSRQISPPSPAGNPMIQLFKPPSLSAWPRFLLPTPHPIRQQILLGLLSAYALHRYHSCSHRHPRSPKFLQGPPQWSPCLLCLLIISHPQRSRGTLPKRRSGQALLCSEPSSGSLSASFPEPSSIHGIQPPHLSLTSPHSPCFIFLSAPAASLTH